MSKMSKLIGWRLIIAASVLCLVGCSQEQEDTATVIEITESPTQTQQIPADSDDWEITNVTGDLYRARSRNHYTVFLVTPGSRVLA